MKRKLSMTKLASLALLLAPCAAAHASTVIFASFNDTAAGQWVYSNGTLTSVGGSTANFTSFGGPNQILNFIGPVTYQVNAIRAGDATLNAGIVSQELMGEITFKSGTNTVLDIVFQGALISGQANSNSSGVNADTTIGGNVISYTTDGIFQVAPFVGPFSFSIALTQSPGLALNGNNLADFTATSSGSFSTNTDRGGSSPTPLPPAAFGGLGLLAGLTGVRRLRRKINA